MIHIPKNQAEVIQKYEELKVFLNARAAKRKKPLALLRARVELAIEHNNLGNNQDVEYYLNGALAYIIELEKRA
jgi:hypothetical protein